MLRRWIRCDACSGAPASTSRHRPHLDPGVRARVLEADTQGTELDVLAGGRESPASVHAVEVEVGYIDPACRAVSYADAIYRRTSR